MHRPRKISIRNFYNYECIQKAQEFKLKQV